MEKCDDKNGKSTIIWWLLGVLQVVFLALGAYGLTSTTGNSEKIARVETKQEQYATDITDIKKDVKDTKKDINDIKNFLINKSKFIAEK